MYLTITPAGTPASRVKYRLNGDERTYSIGTYPAIGLEAARVEREIVKAQLRVGRDPVKERELSRAAGAVASGQTFESLATDWLAKQRKSWSSIHYGKSSRALER